VRAQYDEVGAPFLRLFDDQIGDSATDRFQQHGFDLDAVLAHLGLGSGEKLLSARAQRPNEFIDVARRHVHHGVGPSRHDQLVNDVEQADFRLLIACQADRLFEAAVRRRAAVDGNQNPAEHGKLLRSS
jgi:hypothetical protein